MFSVLKCLGSQRRAWISRSCVSNVLGFHWSAVSKSGLKGIQRSPVRTTLTPLGINIAQTAATLETATLAASATSVSAVDVKAVFVRLK